MTVSDVQREKSNGTFAASEAWIYDTTGAIGADPDLEGPFSDASKLVDLNPVTMGGALIIQEDLNGVADDNARGGTMKFTFSESILLSSIDLLDASMGNVMFKLYDDVSALATSSIVYNSFNGDTHGPANKYETVDFGGATVAWMEVAFMGVSGALDNIVFAKNTTGTGGPISPVPLPVRLGYSELR